MASPVTKPLLILAFNRPAHVKRLIDSLRPYRPQKIFVGIDGPRENNKQDKQKISLVLDEINKIDWTSDIELRVREKNIGLRFAVADAVTWVIEKCGEVIVVEDDVEVGAEFLGYMSEMLDKYRHDNRVGHVSGYNLVPLEILKDPTKLNRLSMIPESYAWATWKRAWVFYDAELSNVPNFKYLRALLKSSTAALVWQINFYDAKRGNINTWAYRWIATLWSENLLCVSPNRNLINYTGAFEGTHTRRAPRHSELELLPISSLNGEAAWTIDETADSWIQKRVFRSSFVGLLIRAIESIALSILKRLS